MKSKLRIYDIIKKKRDGYPLSREEIRYFINGVVSGEIADYQTSAFLMAVYLRGMNYEETTELTLAIRDSGEKADFSGVKGVRADKHSTGGVGDKTSLVVVPAVASLGIKCAKVSGRGLGHTGGTVDKLESVRGFDTGLGKKEFVDAVNEVGCAIIGQTAKIAPADKILYALRDVTATIDSLPLIASSIMGKKLAVGDDVIVLDVKTGSGAFMKTEEESVRLAEIMVEVGKRAGKKTSALVTDMDMPLGRAIGNAVEVKEAIETMKGKGDGRFLSLCAALAAEMLYSAGYGELKDCEKAFYKSINEGKALETFRKMIERQGGDGGVIDDYGKFPAAKFVRDVKAQKTGYIYRIDAEKYGTAACVAGAGRTRAEDAIDFAAGIEIVKTVGEKVGMGETVAKIFSNDENALFEAERIVSSAIEYSESAPDEKPVVIKRIV